MAARTLRRSFAAPFVITLAALPAAHADPKPPEKAPEKAPQEAPKEAPQPSRPTPPRNPPRPKDPPPKTYPHDRRWHVEMKGKDTCVAHAHVNCPPPPPDGGPRPTCNPPPPIVYKCQPDEISGHQEVIQRAGSATCTTVVKPISCPPDMSCNPPPPRKVTCPSR